MFSWDGAGVRVEGSEHLLDQLANELPAFYDDEPSGDVVAQGLITSGDEGLQITLPDGLSVHDEEGPEFFRAAASRVELLVVAALSTRVAVHAGVVAVDGRAVLLPGASHRGKSVLVAALVDAGATYLSDEFALLDEAGQVWPYPRRLTSRTGASSDRTLPARAAAPGGPPVPVAVVADLVFAEGWQVEPLTWGDRVMVLAENTLPVRRDPSRSLSSLSAACEQAAGVRGTRGEADDAAARVLALL